MKNTIMLILTAAAFAGCMPDGNKPLQHVYVDASAQETGTVMQSIAIPGCSLPHPAHFSCSNDPSKCAPCEQEDYICSAVYDDMLDAGVNN